MRPLKPIPEPYIVRNRGGEHYTGNIRVGQVFAWNPDIPEARVLIVVTRITGGAAVGNRIVKHSSGVAVLMHPMTPGNQGIIWCRTLDKPEHGTNDKEFWNEESHFRESVYPTRFRDMEAYPQTRTLQPVDIPQIVIDTVSGQV